MRRFLPTFVLLLAATPLFASLTGTVMTTEGQAVASAKVSLYAPETLDARRARLLSDKPERTALATVQTDSKGTFRFDVPKDVAVVQVGVNAAGYAPAIAEAERDEDIGAIALRPAASKTGTVTAGGKPVANARVLWMTQDTELIATTDAQGKYSVPDPARWAAVGIVAHPDFAPAVLRRAMRDMSAMKVDWTLDAGTSLKGRVVAADGQTPVAKATILVDGWPVTTSGDDGTFTLAHMAKTWETLAARSGNLLAERARGNDTSALRLAKAATITGTLKDAKTQYPLAGATVRIMEGNRFDRGVSQTAITDAKGGYAIALAPGTYRIAGSHPSYELEPVAVSPAAGQVITRNMLAQPLARISGTVLDEDNKGVAAAVIQPDNGDGMPRFRGGMPIGGQASAASGPDGRFVFKTPEGDVQLAANKKGFPAGKSARLHVAAAERKSGVTITIPNGIAVTGRVLDRSGKPLSGVAINSAPTESNPGGPMMRRMTINLGMEDDENLVRTQSDGTFSMRVKQGTYDFLFKREGFAAKSVRAQEVAPGIKPLEVTLDPGAEITGRVTRAGTPLEGVSVSAFGESGLARTTTGPDGTFRLADLTPGPAMVNVTKPEEFVQEMRNINAPARDVAIDLPRGARLSGRVVDKTTKKPVTSFQAGLSGVRGGGGFVMAGPPQMRSFTSDDGTFTLDNVPTGTQQLMVTAPGYAPTRLPNLALEDGKELRDVQVELDAGSKVSGRVTGPDGGPVSGASVRLAASVPGRTARVFGMESNTTTTDQNGEYSLEGIESGEKTFAFSHNSYLPTEKTIDISSREVKLDVQLSAGMHATGQVTTEAGVPIADASVRANSAAGSFVSATTDASGMFSLENLAPGRYRISASKNGYASASVDDFDITAGAPLRLMLKSGSVIYGHVTGLSEQELASAEVDARGPNGGASAPVDASGNYRIEGAPTGSVRVSASLTGGLLERRTSKQETVQVESGSSRQVDLAFVTGTSIHGHVTRNGRPLQNANVTFIPRGTSQTFSSAPTNENGEYTVNGVEDGKYAVQVMDMQRLNPFSTTYDVSGSGTFDIDIKTVPLRGRVVDSATGEPVEGAQVQLRNTSSDMPFAQRMATTDAAGGFTLDSVSSGRYTATANREGYGSDTQNVSVSDTSADPLEFKLSRNDGVTLRVVDARDNRLLSASASVIDAQGRTVLDDSFRFGGSAEPLRLSLAPGTYQATISAMGYAPRTITITAPSQQTIGLTPGGTLIVRSTSSVPRRARLLDANGHTYRTFFRGNIFPLDPAPGIATIQNVAGGTYTLQVLGDNDEVVSTVKVTVVDGQTANVDA